MYFTNYTVHNFEPYLDKTKIILLLCSVASAMFSAINVPGVKSLLCQQILNPCSSKKLTICVSTKFSSGCLEHRDIEMVSLGCIIDLLYTQTHHLTPNIYNFTVDNM